MIVAKRSSSESSWRPTVPALVHMLAASAGPGLRAAFVAAGLDGLRPAQSVALVPLAAGPLHASGLADRLRVSRQAVAQAIRTLEAHGYVVRSPDDRDARALLIALTPRGRQALSVMRSNAIAVEQHWQQVLGRQRLGELRETVQLLLDT
jgi:DNA-binding MarR family transcriptional regulator